MVLVQSVGLRIWDEQLPTGAVGVLLRERAGHDVPRAEVEDELGALAAVNVGEEGGVTPRRGRVDDFHVGVAAQGPDGGEGVQPRFGVFGVGGRVSLLLLTSVAGEAKDARVPGGRGRPNAQQ